MKNIILVIFFAFPMVLDSSSLCIGTMASYKARLYGAQAKESLRVIDQNGRPVASARVFGGLQTGDGYNDFVPIRGMTDTNGEYVIQGRCTNRIRCDITKTGYYASEFLVKNYRDTHRVENGKWYPYGCRRTIVLKQILNPQPMVCRNALNSIAIPKHNVWLGFDFEQYDFVAPYGNGKSDDVLLRFDLDRPSQDEYYMTMHVSFTNQPYAGAYKLKTDMGSELKIAYEANTNGCFNQDMVYRFQRGKNSSPVYDMLQDDEYLVFRTRTRVDKDGNLISAHYGAICGEWNFAGPSGFRIDKFIFNPRPNDVNLEDVETADYSRMGLKQRMERQRR